MSWFDVLVEIIKMLGLAVVVYLIGLTLTTLAEILIALNLIVDIIKAL